MEYAIALILTCYIVGKVCYVFGEKSGFVKGRLNAIAEYLKTKETIFGKGGE